VDQETFDHATRHIEKFDANENIGATPFEILTATALKIFSDARCNAAVLECGMGGRHDATNVYPRGFKRVTVISKVGLDHQDFLGNTIEDIAQEKCGIFARHVPVVFDTSNEAAVLRVIRQEVQKEDAYISYPWDKSAFATGPLPQEYTEDKVAAILKASPLGKIPYQLANAEIGFRAAYTFLDQIQFHKQQSVLRSLDTILDSDNGNLQKLSFTEDPQVLLDAIASTTIPGRFQTVSLSPLLGGLNRSMTLDGAHNAQAIEAIAPALAALRATSPSGKITWVVAFSEGKALDEMLAPLLRPGDYVAATEFGPVDGMPWKKAMPSEAIVECLESLKSMGVKVFIGDFGRDIESALHWATSGLGIPVVGIGSLYLVSDVLRLLENAGSKVVQKRNGNS
jgi:folylpolyglutamate synthase/dihydrofolate synthase